MLTAHNPTKIAALNDAARKSFSGCRVYMTPGVQALYQTQDLHHTFSKQGRGRALACSSCGSFSYLNHTTVYRCECGSDERSCRAALTQ